MSMHTDPNRRPAINTSFMKTIVVAAVSTVIAAGVSMLPVPAVADTLEQQFLGIVRSNGVPGQDDTLINYAHEYCSGAPWLPSGPALMTQGVGLGGLYVVRVAATQVYCPGKIAVPLQAPQVLTGL